MSGGAHHARLANQQAALVAALVAGGETPPGFAEDRVSAARQALLRKRAGEAARAWPVLAATLGPPGWAHRFAQWAAGRPPRGALRDGWDLARALAAGEGLPAPAADELAVREVRWRYRGDQPPRLRRLPAVRRCPDGLLVQVAGRVARLPGPLRQKTQRRETR